MNENIFGNLLQEKYGMLSLLINIHSQKTFRKVLVAELQVLRGANTKSVTEDKFIFRAGFDSQN